MDWLANLLRRARLRGLVDGKVQTVRAESLQDQAHDDAERHLDYGFTAHPVDGQGLVLHVGGHTIVLRMDRIAERPQLQPFEVSVWHKEGHRVTLKAGRLVQVDCDHLVVNASADVTINTPLMTVNASDQVNLQTPLVVASDNVDVGNNLHVANTTTSDTDVLSGPISLRHHKSSLVSPGAGTSGPPVP